MKQILSYCREIFNVELVVVNKKFSSLLQKQYSIVKLSSLNLNSRRMLLIQMKKKNLHLFLK